MIKEMKQQKKRNKGQGRRRERPLDGKEQKKTGRQDVGGEKKKL